MGKPSAPSPPDYTPIAQASQQQSQLADNEFQQQLGFENSQMDLQKQALNWAQDQYAQNQTQNKGIQDADIATQNAATAAAQNAQKQYETVFQPLEDQYVQESKDYGSQANQQFAAGQAMSGVSQQFEQQRQNAAQNLEAFGVDPSSTRYAAMDIGVRTQQAAAAAAAGSNAALQTRQAGMGLEGNAINIGMGLPANINAGQNTSVNAGSSAANTALATTASGAQTMGTGVQYGGLAQGFGGTAVGALNAGTGAVNAWGNALNEGFNNQMSAFNANQQSSSGIGSLLGTAIGSAGFALADGGAVPQSSALPTTGGRVPINASPSNGTNPDDVPARLTADEFVVPRDVAKWKGEEFFQKLIAKSREDKTTNRPAQARVALPIPGRAPTFNSSPMPPQAMQQRPMALPVR